MASKRFKVKNGVTYRYHVAAEGYTTPTGVQNPGYVTIDGQPQPITIELVPATNFYSFTIYTDTANTVVINDEQIYDTGHTGQFTKSNIAEGTQIIYEVSRNGYNSEDNTDNPIILNQDTDINITLTPAVKRLTVNVNGYDNVQGTTTNITQSCTFTFTVNGQTTTTSDNYIDVQADTTVKFNVICSGYTEKLYSQGGTLPLDHYVTVGNSSRTETVIMEKSTNQYTVTWNVVDGAGNPITGYEINVTVNDGTTHSIPGNTYTGTINDKIVWSCGIDQQHTVDGGVIYHLTSDQTLTATLRGQTYTATVTVYNGPSTQNIKVEGATVRFINTSTQQYEEVLTNSNGSATYGVEYGVIYNVAVSKTGFWNEPTQDEIAYYPTYPYRVGKTNTMNELNIGISILPSSTYWEFSVVPTPNTPVTVTMNNTQVSVIRTTADGDSYGGLFPPRTLVNYEITTTLPGYQSLSGSEYISDKDNFKDMPKTLPAESQQEVVFMELEGEPFSVSVIENGVEVPLSPDQDGNYHYNSYVGDTVYYIARKTGWEDVSGSHLVNAQAYLNYVTVQFTTQDLSSQYLTMELTDSDDELYFCAHSNVSSGTRITSNTFDPSPYNIDRTIIYSTDDGSTWNSVRVFAGYTLISTDPNTGNKTFRGTPTTTVKINVGVGQRVIFRYYTGVGYYYTCYGGDENDNASTYTHFKNKNYGTSQVYVYGNLKSLSHGGTGVKRFANLFNGLDAANKYVNGVLKPIILSDNDINLGRLCYENMFNGCIHLTDAPTLPKKSLASYCYRYMFNGCTSLTTAPALPATTLANGCYYGMFQGCTSLTTAPALPATTLTDYCYDSMFNGCTSLNSITCLATNISATDCTDSWVDGVASTGTFVKNPNMNNWSTGVDGIPTNWTIRNVS